MPHESCDVAIIGAGPYGLATAAHLKEAKVSARIFGDTMSFWRGNMPSGMRLRSPWRASTISDPNNDHTLDVYAKTTGIPHTENLPLTDFVKYGEWFQRRAVPNVDKRMIKTVTAGPKGFRLHLNDSDTIDAKRVVVAMGLANQSYKPAAFDGLSSDLVLHSSELLSPADYRGRRVAVVGRGQSACESAVLLSEAGAEVELISHGDVRWIGLEDGDTARSESVKWWTHSVLTAPSAIGPFPFNWLVDAPTFVSMLSPGLRKAFSERALRAAASAWLKVRSGGIKFNSGRSILGARAKGKRIEFQLDNGPAEFDHAVLGTGYRSDISKFGVLAPEIVAQVKLSANYPVLSNGFKSSVPGLHFVGAVAVGSFGPLTRFVAGCGYAARCVTGAALANPARSTARRMPQTTMQQLP